MRAALFIHSKSLTMIFKTSGGFPGFPSSPDNPALDYSGFTTRTSEDAAAYISASEEYTAEEITALLESGEFSFQERIVYNIVSNNNTFDEGVEKVSYAVRFYYGKDGVKLEKLYNSVATQPDQVLVFIENNEGDFFSGQRIYVKMHSNVREKFKAGNLDRDYVATVVQHWRTSEPGQVMGKQSNPDDVMSWINALTGKPSKMQDLAILLYVVAQPYLKAVKTIGDFALDEVIGGLDEIIKFIESLQFDPKSWNPESVGPNEVFQPFFIPFVYMKKGKVYFNIPGNKDISITDMNDKAIQALEDQFDDFNKQLDENYQNSAVLPYIFPASSGHHPLYDLVNAAKITLVFLLKEFLNFLKESAIFLNAVLCGLVDSLIEIVLGIFWLVKAVFLVIKASFDAQFGVKNVSEHLDNLIQQLVKIDLKAVFKHIVEFVNEVSEKVGTAIASYLVNLSSAEIGYFVGYVIGFIIEQLLGAVTFGATNVNSFVRKGFKAFKAIMDTIADILKKVMKNVGKTILHSIDNFVAFLAKGTDNLLEVIDNIGKAIMQWLDELVGDGLLSKDVDELFRKKVTSKHDHGVRFTRPELKKFASELELKYKSLKLKVEIVNDSPKFKDRLRKWEMRNVQGSFNQGPPPVIYVRQRCTELTMQHEMWHLEDYRRLGPKKYKAIPDWKHEESVWNKVWATKHKWTDEELVDSYWYYKKECFLYGENPLKIEEAEELLKSFPGRIKM